MDNHNALGLSDLEIPLIDHVETDEELGRSLEATGAGATALSSSKIGHSLGFGALVFLIYYNIGVPFGDEGVRRTLLTCTVASA